MIHYQKSTVFEIHKQYKASGQRQKRLQALGSISELQMRVSIL